LDSPFIQPANEVLLYKPKELKPIQNVNFTVLDNAENSRQFNCNTIFAAKCMVSHYVCFKCFIMLFGCITTMFQVIFILVRPSTKVLCCKNITNSIFIHIYVFNWRNFCISTTLRSKLCTWEDILLQSVNF